MIQNEGDVEDKAEVDALKQQVINGMVGELVCSLLRVRRKDGRVW